MGTKAPETKTPARMIGAIGAPELSGIMWTKADEFTLRHKPELEEAKNLSDAHDIIVGARKGKKADEWVGAILTMCSIRGVSVAGHRVVKAGDAKVRIDGAA